MVAVSRASFYRLPTGSLVMICAGHFPRRALPLVAKVGAVHVQGISISPDGQSFMGTLNDTPNAGDEVVVRYLPEPPTRTGIRFPRLAVA